MKKTLFLVRHAKASEAVSPDLYRPLTSSGMIDAARLGKHLKEKMLSTQLVVCSNAERAQMTAQVFCEQIGLANEVIQVDEKLYMAAPKDYLALINQLPETLTSVMIVGHNPNISYFAEYLTHELIGSMPTCGVVGIELEGIAWAEVTKKSGKMLFYDSPDSILGLKFD